MAALVYACIAPHPPVIVPEVSAGREGGAAQTIEALKQAARDLQAAEPETVVLMATHGPLDPQAFVVLAAERVKGDFAQWGAPEVRFEAPGDRELAETIIGEARHDGLPVRLIDRWDGGLDWSCTVPLYHLRPALAESRVLPINVCLLPPRAHFGFGRAVRRAIEKQGRRTAVIASADLSHRLSEDGPYGFHRAGPQFDQMMVDAVTRWDVDAVLSLDEQFRRQAGEDAVPSVSFLMGVLHGIEIRPRVLSYEAPFGVGYMVAMVDVVAGRTPEFRFPKASVEKR